MQRQSDTSSRASSRRKDEKDHVGDVVLLEDYDPFAVVAGSRSIPAEDYDPHEGMQVRYGGFGEDMHMHQRGRPVTPTGRNPHNVKNPFNDDEDEDCDSDGSHSIDNIACRSVYSNDMSSVTSASNASTISSHYVHKDTTGEKVSGAQAAAQQLHQKQQQQAALQRLLLHPQHQPPAGAAFLASQVRQQRRRGSLGSTGTPVGGALPGPTATSAGRAMLLPPGTKSTLGRRHSRGNASVTDARRNAAISPNHLDSSDDEDPHKMLDSEFRKRIRNLITVLSDATNKDQGQNKDSTSIPPLSSPLGTEDGVGDSSDEDKQTDEDEDDNGVEGNESFLDIRMKQLIETLKQTTASTGTTTAGKTDTISTTADVDDSNNTTTVAKANGSQTTTSPGTSTTTENKNPFSNQTAPKVEPATPPALPTNPFDDVVSLHSFTSHKSKSSQRQHLHQQQNLKDDKSTTHSTEASTEEVASLRSKKDSSTASPSITSTKESAAAKDSSSTASSIKQQPGAEPATPSPTVTQRKDMANQPTAKTNNKKAARTPGVAEEVESEDTSGIGVEGTMPLKDETTTKRSPPDITQTQTSESSTTVNSADFFKSHSMMSWMVGSYTDDDEEDDEKKKDGGRNGGLLPTRSTLDMNLDQFDKELEATLEVSKLGRSRQQKAKVSSPLTVQEDVEKEDGEEEDVDAAMNQTNSPARSLGKKSVQGQEEEDGTRSVTSRRSATSNQTAKSKSTVKFNNTSGSKSSDDDTPSPRREDAPSSSALPPPAPPSSLPPPIPPAAPSDALIRRIALKERSMPAPPSTRNLPSMGPVRSSGPLMKKIAAVGDDHSANVSPTLNKTQVNNKNKEEEEDIISSDEDISIYSGGSKPRLWKKKLGKKKIIGSGSSVGGGSVASNGSGGAGGNSSSGGGVTALLSGSSPLMGSRKGKRATLRPPIPRGSTRNYLKKEKRESAPSLLAAMDTGLSSSEEQVIDGGATMAQEPKSQEAKDAEVAIGKSAKSKSGEDKGPKRGYEFDTIEVIEEPTPEPPAPSKYSSPVISTEKAKQATKKNVERDFGIINNGQPASTNSFNTTQSSGAVDDNGFPISPNSVSEEKSSPLPTPPNQPSSIPEMGFEGGTSTPTAAAGDGFSPMEFKDSKNMMEAAWDFGGFDASTPQQESQPAAAMWEETGNSIRAAKNAAGTPTSQKMSPAAGSAFAPTSRSPADSVSSSKSGRRSRKEPLSSSLSLPGLSPRQERARKVLSPTSPHLQQVDSPLPPPTGSPTLKTIGGGGSSGGAFAPLSGDFQQGAALFEENETEGNPFFGGQEIGKNHEDSNQATTTPAFDNDGFFTSSSLPQETEDNVFDKGEDSWWNPTSTSDTNAKSQITTTDPWGDSQEVSSLFQKSGDTHGNNPVVFDDKHVSLKNQPHQQQFQQQFQEQSHQQQHQHEQFQQQQFQHQHFRPQQQHQHEQFRPQQQFQHQQFQHQQFQPQQQFLQQQFQPQQQFLHQQFQPQQQFLHQQFQPQQQQTQQYQPQHQHVQQFQHQQTQQFQHQQQQAQLYQPQQQQAQQQAQNYQPRPQPTQQQPRQQPSQQYQPQNRHTQQYLPQQQKHQQQQQQQTHQLLSAQQHVYHPKQQHLQHQQRMSEEESYRVDAVEAAAKRRIEMLRKMIADKAKSPSTSSDGESAAMISQLAYIESETLKQISRVRGRMNSHEDQKETTPEHQGGGAANMI